MLPPAFPTFSPSDVWRCNDFTAYWSVLGAGSWHDVHGFLQGFQLLLSLLFTLLQRNWKSLKIYGNYGNWVRQLPWNWKIQHPPKLKIISSKWQVREVWKALRILSNTAIFNKTPGVLPSLTSLHARWPRGLSSIPWPPFSNAWPRHANFILGNKIRDRSPAPPSGWESWQWAKNTWKICGEVSRVPPGRQTSAPHSTAELQRAPVHHSGALSLCSRLLVGWEVLELVNYQLIQLDLTRWSGIIWSHPPSRCSAHSRKISINWQDKCQGPLPLVASCEVFSTLVDCRCFKSVSWFTGFTPSWICTLKKWQGWHGQQGPPD